MRGFHIPSVIAVVAVGLMNVGCVVVVHDDRPAPPPPQRVVVVPTPEPEPVREVVYEPPPREVVVVYERDLEAYGHWVLIEPYGRCWVWDHRPYGWRPYTVGHWVATRDGWLWVAEDDEAPWGATCFHYGRWFHDPFNGWVWVPGRVWAPNWCAWREGPEHTCWAPLPPDCGDGHLVSVTVVEQRIPPANYVVVETRNVTNVNVVKNVIVNNTVIVNKTVNITNITYVNGRAVNKGVDITHVERATGHKIQPQTTTTVTTQEEAHRLQSMGQAVVYSPNAVSNYAKQHPILPRKSNPTHTDNGAKGSKVNPDHKDNQPNHVNAEEHHAPPAHVDHPLQPAKEEHHVDHPVQPAKEEHHVTPTHVDHPVQPAKEEHHTAPDHRTTPTEAEEEHKKTPPPHKNVQKPEPTPENRNTAHPKMDTQHPENETKPHPKDKNPKDPKKTKEEDEPKKPGN